MNGTTLESGLKGLLNVKKCVQDRYPQTTVKITFTSDIICRVWRKRAKDKNYRKAHKDISADVLDVQGMLSVLANLQESGHESIVVQSVHIAPGEEYFNICNYIDALSNIFTIREQQRPFKKLLVGRPALGAPGYMDHPVDDDLAVAANALREDMELAMQNEAALLYMGHGNPLIPSSSYYIELVHLMRKMVPDVPVFIGLMKSYPTIVDIIKQLKDKGIGRVVMKPLMITAGSHVVKDMIASGNSSWLSFLRKENVTVTPVIRGLGEQKDFVEIFIRHIADAALEGGVELL